MKRLTTNRSYLHTIQTAHQNQIFGQLSLDLFARIKTRAIFTSVTTNANGTLFIPNIGYLLTKLPDENLLLACDAGRHSLTLFKEQQIIDFDYLGTFTLPDSPIRIALHHHTLTETFYSTNFGLPRGTSLEVTNRNVPILLEGVALLRRAFPEYWELTTLCTKEIVLFRNPQRNSFATEASCGTCFINVLDEEASSVFFIEDLVHQCGHLILSAVAFEPHEFLAVSPDLPLKELTSSESEHRTILSAFHGLFTEAMIAKSLDLCLERGVFQGFEVVECLGRLTFIMRKMRHDLMNMNIKEIYTTKGANFFGWLVETFIEIQGRRAREVQSLNLGEQSYTFSTREFLRANPGLR
jgi:hypothetical protein